MRLLGLTGFWGGVHWVALKRGWACLLSPQEKMRALYGYDFLLWRLGTWVWP